MNLTLSRIQAIDSALTARLRLANETGILRACAIAFAHSADSWFWLAGLGLFWLFGPHPWRTFETQLILGILITAALVMITKFTIRRRRPEGDWGNIYRKTDPHSFPSGHAARAVMLAMLFGGLSASWLGAILLFWALLVSLARVALGVHYLSDVLAGAAFGALTGWALLLIFR